MFSTIRQQLGFLLFGAFFCGVCFQRSCASSTAILEEDCSQESDLYVGAQVCFFMALGAFSKNLFDRTGKPAFLPYSPCCVISEDDDEPPSSRGPNEAIREASSLQ